jgi:hypothetical protein
MPRVRGEGGRFIEGGAKTVLSIKINEELRDKLRGLPNTNKYIESLLYEKMVHMQIADSDWEYHPQWDALFEIIIIAGRAIEKLAQYEERCDDADAIWEDTLKQFHDWSFVQSPFL